MNPRPKAVYLKDYQPPPFLIDEVLLSVDLYEDRALVRARLACRRNPALARREEDLHLDGRELKLLGLRLDGLELAPDRYRLDPESLTVFGVPDRFSLESEAEIYPQNNTALEGLYRSGGKFCTQCEAEGFRKITWFCDRPDVLARYTVTISADRQSCPVLLANGNLVQQGELPGGRHFAVWQDPFPKPSYLFAMVAGPLICLAESFVTRSGRTVLLEIYVEEHNRNRCGHAMASLKKAMRWDEETFGLEYDLDRYMIVAVDDFNMGAMENKGLNIFNSKYVLAEAATATDDDYEGIEAVIAHEYFHNWTGNRVTCRDWFQLSLKEGLTVFRDQQFTADMLSPPVKRIEDVRTLRKLQFPEDRGPMAHPVQPDRYIAINNFYTVTVYEKGAELIRMLHTLLGQELFCRGLSLYLNRHDGQAATIDDFVRAMAEVSGRDLSQFKRWYSQAGTPELVVSMGYDAASGTCTVDLVQRYPVGDDRTEKGPLHIPVALALLDAQGREIRLNCPERPQEAARGLFELREASEQLCFTGLAARPALSILRNFSAPVNLVWDASDAELLFLFRHDTDPFNRWDAGQRLAVRLILSLVEDHRQGRELVLADDFVQAFAELLAGADQVADPAFLALLLSLPSQEYLAEQMEVVAVESIHAACQYVRRRLAGALDSRWLALYQALRPCEAYRYDQRSAGGRSLKNLCLSYLAALKDDRAAGLCLAQFEQADNMTDQYAAFAALVHSGRPERLPLIEEFYRRWQHEPLVLDKWFAVQATAPLPETLATVQSLMNHPAFTLKNPNRVRSLIGAFAGGNPLCFHQISGEGYRFLADRIIDLDPMNPQIAARLTARFASWRRYDQTRQAQIRSQLERICALPGLSGDVYEMASRSLSGS